MTANDVDDVNGGIYMYDTSETLRKIREFESSRVRD